MSLYKVRTKYRKCCNGITTEPGMEVQVLTPGFTTYHVDDWKYVEEAFMRVYGISMRKAGCLNTSALDLLWDPKRDYYSAPKNNGAWSGEACNSLWIPEDSFVPANREYSNLHNLSWRQIKQKHGFKALRCARGRFCFEDIAHYSVRVLNFSELCTSSNREALHNAAFELLAGQLGLSVDEVRAIKESRNDYTPMGRRTSCGTRISTAVRSISFLRKFTETSHTSAALECATC